MSANKVSSAEIESAWIVLLKTKRIKFWQIPYKERTEELCRIAIDYNGSYLLYVPNILKTQSLCWNAVRNNARSLEYVPIGLKTFDLCKMAYKKNKSSEKFIPKLMRHQVTNE